MSINFMIFVKIIFHIWENFLNNKIIYCLEIRKELYIRFLKEEIRFITLAIDLSFCLANGNWSAWIKYGWRLGPGWYFYKVSRMPLCKTYLMNEKYRPMRKHFVNNPDVLIFYASVGGCSHQNLFARWNQNILALSLL